jgi:hypothetical protein
MVADMFGRGRDCKTTFISLRFPNIIKAEKWAALPWPAPSAERPLTLLMWAYAHEEDVVNGHVVAASAVLAADVAHQVVVLAAPDTRFAEDTADLLVSQFGAKVAERIDCERLVGQASVLESGTAQRVLGIFPRR